MTMRLTALAKAEHGEPKKTARTIFDYLKDEFGWLGVVAVERRDVRSVNIRLLNVDDPEVFVNVYL